MDLGNFKKNILEFCRYILVGGSAFVIDIGLVWLCNEFIFSGNYIYLSVFIGYTIGLIYNFFLSCGFVFENGFEKIRNKEISSFIIFTIIGLIGLLLTELLMLFFIRVLCMYYIFAKILTGAIVMFWNYIARKIIIFKSEIK